MLSEIGLPFGIVLPKNLFQTCDGVRVEVGFIGTFFTLVPFDTLDGPPLIRVGGYLIRDCLPSLVATC
jgi:hypothetical protein